jgi:hypothetical protein
MKTHTYIHTYIYTCIHTSRIRQYPRARPCAPTREYLSSTMHHHVTTVAPTELPTEILTSPSPTGSRSLTQLRAGLSATESRLGHSLLGIYLFTYLYINIHSRSFEVYPRQVQAQGKSPGTQSPMYLFICVGVCIYA